MFQFKILSAAEALQRNITPVFAVLAKEAVSAAVARQKALGLPNYYSKNGRIYGRMPNGRFTSAK